MRYYHPFPEAIPHSEAGSSRVTHPSATKIKKQALLSPFDLHVLSVPPAFVLSQDQTLYFSCILTLFSELLKSIQSITFFRSQLPFLRLFLLPVCARQSQRFSYLQLNFKGLFACSALFNFQDTILMLRSSIPSVLAATFTLYHFRRSLSSEISVNSIPRLHKLNLIKFFCVSDFIVHFPTALLLYHMPAVLSRRNLALFHSGLCTICTNKFFPEFCRKQKGGDEHLVSPNISSFSGFY